ncbi:MAG: glycosyltransferase [Bacteroidales bacterium]|jgi:SAM-dependent methyltransferase/NACalpha-BTF3-like transcription factor|nr:glycosyltransferase [Bacteroidales bacterium]
MTKQEIINFFRSQAAKREKWNKRNGYYHRLLEKYYSFIIPQGKRVLEIGCGSGNLLNAVKPLYGVGIDFAPEVIDIARSKYPHLNFYVDDVENLQLEFQSTFLQSGEMSPHQTFDYIIISDTMGCLWDAQKAIHNIRTLCGEQTRIIISQYNFLWEPIIKMLEFFGLKQKQSIQANWFSDKDVVKLLALEDFSIIRQENKVLFPANVPILKQFFNSFLANLPLFNSLCLVNLIIARLQPKENKQASVTIVVPARNEKGNIENAIKRTPDFGTHQEFIFIEGNSQDDTYEEIERVQKAYPDKDIKIMHQTGKGKGNAVREAFDAATGDILMILDADLTVSPEELPKFYNALCEGKGEFINGCRLVYPMDKNAMRFLNLLGNKFFGWFFSYLLGQPLKDTLCGTKVLLRSDYEIIKANRSYFGDFDPFGDFDLLFGAAKQNLKIIEVIIRYKDREYGSTQISRFKHGVLLFQMSGFAARKIKFI